MLGVILMRLAVKLEYCTTEKKEFIVEKTRVCKCQASAKRYQQHFNITTDLSQNCVISTERIFVKTYYVLITTKVLIDVHEE
jgi:hypothetical protein